MADHRPEQCFLAHLGEDRFLLGARADLHGPLARLIRAFDEPVLRAELFNTRDLERRSFEATDATGQTSSYPLTTVRAIFMPSPLLELPAPRDLHARAHELRLAESAAPDRVIVDRRQQVAGRRSA
jgi:hypothetical protein